jgi:anti-sigma factor RsiW
VGRGVALVEDDYIFRRVSSGGIRLSENAHQIENEAYNQNHPNAPAAISWAAKVESASAKQEN